MNRGILVGVLFVFAGVARADTLTDLRARIAALDGNEPVRGIITQQINHRAGEGKNAATHVGKATVRFAAGEDGLSLTWDLAHLNAASGKKPEAKEAPKETAADGEEPPSRQAMRDLNAATIHGLISTGSGMLQKLENAELLSEKTETIDGRTQRVLQLKLNPKLGEKNKKYIKDMTAVASLWLDADGFPVRAESKLKVKVRAFLVIGFESEEQEEFSFARVGRRLVTTHHKKHATGAGTGEEFDRSSETTVTLQDNRTVAEQPAAAASEATVLTR